MSLASLPLLLCLSLLPQEGGAPATIDTLYVVEFCHADVGFNAAPSVMQQRNHDRTVAALNLMDQRSDFVWTIETTYQLENFLARASAADVQRLKTRLAQGRLAYGVNFTNLHSGNVGEEQYARLPLEAERLGAQLGHRGSTAFLNDVPGFSGGTPRILASAGAPYAVLGPNDSFGGKPDIPLQDRPFWWQGPDGSRTLTWITYGSYAEGFVEWGLLNLPTAEAKVAARLAEYHAAGYPYDAVLIERAFDDTFPNAGMANLAAQWNAAHSSPKIKLATAAEFFEHIQAKYGDVFPTYEGDASGMWEDVTIVTPASTSLVRRARSALPQVEALRTVLLAQHGLAYPAVNLREAWKHTLVFDEHSGGGVGWPGLLTKAEIEQENKDFVHIARTSKRLADKEQDNALNFAGPVFVPQHQGGLVVFNPLGGAFHGILEVDCGAQPAGLRLVDPAGGPDPRFRWLAADRSRLAVEVDLPAHGWRRWRLEGGGQTPPPPAWSNADRISIGGRELVLDAVDGTALSLVDAATGIDWLAQPGPHKFGGLESEIFLRVLVGQWKESNPQPVTLLAEEPGALFRRIVVRGPDGTVLREYRLYEDQLRVDFTAVMDRWKMAPVPFDDHSRHYGVAFAANLELPTALRVDGPDGWFQPGADSLPGSAFGQFAASTGAILSGSSGRWMAVTSVDTPSLHLGEMNGAPVNTIETDENTLSWKLIRLHSQGQVKGGAIVDINPEPGLDQPWPFEFQIRFGQSGDTQPDRMQLRSDMAPPLSRWVTRGSADPALPASGQWFSLVGPGDLVGLKRSQDGSGVILRIRAQGSGGDVDLSTQLPLSSAWLADLVERPQQQLSVVGNSVRVPLPPQAVVTVLVRP